MKKCSQCSFDKSLDDFGTNLTKADGKQPYCKQCGKDKDRRHYLQSESRRNKIRQNREAGKVRNGRIVREYLLNNPCIDCGEADPIVLEFDHVNSEKTYNISNMMNNLSIENLLAEINKCEVRCANCHRKKTAKQFDWYKYLTM